MVADRQQHKGECHAACDEAAGHELVHWYHLLSLIVVALTCLGIALVIHLLRCPACFSSLMTCFADRLFYLVTSYPPRKGGASHDRVVVGGWAPTRMCR